MSSSSTQTQTSVFGPRGPTWLSGKSPTVWYTEGLLALNPHWGQDEEAEQSHLTDLPCVKKLSGDNPTEISPSLWPILQTKKKKAKQIQICMV